MIKMRVAFVTFLLLLIALPAIANEPLASRQLEEGRLSGQGVHQILAKLALRYDIPIGFERAMNSADLDILHVQLKRGTLADFLTEFLSQHKEYSWEITDEVVNVFPKPGFRDPIVAELSSVQLASFSLEKAVTWDVEMSLLKTPEFQQLIESYGLTTRNGWVLSGSYLPTLGRNYSLNTSNATVKAILNRIVKESPTAKFWTIFRDSDQHMFFLNLDANHEDTPKELRRRAFEEMNDVDLLP